MQNFSMLRIFYSQKEINYKKTYKKIGYEVAFIEYGKRRKNQHKEFNRILIMCII